jgi:phosphoesterase RecJ-like protein
LTSRDLRRLLDLVLPGRRFVLTTHVHPDGDGVGSQLALARFLAARGAAVRIVNRDGVPAGLRFLEGSEAVEVYAPAAHDALLRDADAVVMLDNSDPRRLEEMERPVRAARGVTVCIDHHPDPDPFWGLLLVDGDAPCTGTIVHRILAAAGAPLDAATATALYTALASDTGRFRFGNTSERAFAMASELVAAGAVPARIYASLEEKQSPGYVRLFGELLAGLELRRDGRVVVLRLPRALAEERGALGEDLSEVINQSLKIETSRVAALFRELAPAATKVSLRSKGDLDVNGLARRHGGGGHRNASGIVFQLPLDEAVARLAPDLDDLVS